ncbi:MAG: transporter, transrane component, partial [Ramlibacter sp.]|nr:transporter, transrane component [Ramlibacter sp.]
MAVIAASDSHRTRAPRTGAFRATLVYQTLLIVGIFALWEALVRLEILPVYLYGQPSGIFAKGRTLLLEGDLARDFGATAFASILGF